MGPEKLSSSADIYVLVGLESDEVWSRIGRKPEDIPSGFKARESAVQRKAQSLLAGLDDWTYEKLSIDPAVVADRAIAAEISNEGLSAIPDTLGWSPLRIVSTRLKESLVEEFPDGSEFFPFYYRDKCDGMVKSADFWYWLPAHYLWFRSNANRSREQAMRPHVWGALGKPEVTWEMFNNKAFQSFASQLPFWTPSPRFKEVAFRRDVYQRLSSKGFSGFCEAPVDNYLRHGPEHSVGFVYYGK